METKQEIKTVYWTNQFSRLTGRASIEEFSGALVAADEVFGGHTSFTGLANSVESDWYGRPMTQLERDAVSQYWTGRTEGERRIPRLDQSGRPVV
jgi:hypothetical protein